MIVFQTAAIGCNWHAPLFAAKSGELVRRPRLRTGRMVALTPGRAIRYGRLHGPNANAQPVFNCESEAGGKPPSADARSPTARRPEPCGGRAWLAFCLFGPVSFGVLARN